MFKNPAVRKGFNDQFYTYAVKISAGYAYYWFYTCTHVAYFPGKSMKIVSVTDKSAPAQDIAKNPIQARGALQGIEFISLLISG